MKNTNYLFVILFLLTTCFISCSNDDDNETDFVEEPKKYELVSIMWKLDEASGDGVEMISVKLNPKTVNNNTSIKQPVEYNPLETVKQTSYFEYENKDAEFLNKWMPENMEVIIPTEPVILSSRYSYMASGVKAPLELQKEREVGMTTKISYSTDLTPKTKITYGGTVHFKKITATYCLQFSQKDHPFVDVEITGKWTGVIYDYLESETTVDEIK